MVEIVQAAEDTGYEAVFVPEIAGREAFSTLTGFALATSTISLGTGVVTIPSRSPVATAMGAATVHDLSGGRMILGIGTGAVRDVARMSRGSVLELTGRYTETVKRALSGQDVQPDETVGAPRFRLALRLTAGRPPVWLGALGDGMIRLAGRVADGVLLNWCTPERVADAKRRLAEGAAQVGRDPAELTVAVYVRACLGVEEPIALEALREMTGLYASFRPYRKQFELMGLGREASAAATAFDAGRPREL
jgi:alkanesulfonate monooxygenase SsuD/methylene tetrahydromethanopterin reductase-like flavin-dependent oxidoreductase (luciferase family)